MTEPPTAPSRLRRFCSWGALALLALTSVACTETQGPLFAPRDRRASTKLIYFGAPLFAGLEGLQDLAQGVREVEKSPFDGLVLDMGLPSIFDPGLLQKSEHQAAVSTLRATPFVSLRRNFQLLMVRPVPWFDEERLGEARLNATRMAELVREAGLQGIVIDTQSYNHDGWAYDPALGPSFVQTEAQVRRWGEEIMTAFLQGFPRLTVMLTLGPSETFRAVCLFGEAQEETRYGLLPAFVDGMEAARLAQDPRAALVDGFLPAYPTRDPRALRVFKAVVRGQWEDAVQHWVPGMVTYTFPRQGGSWDDGAALWPESPTLTCTDDTRRSLGRRLGVGFGLMLDYEHDVRGGFRLDPAAFAENYHTPESFAQTVGQAAALSDGLVWIHNSTVAWWLDGRPHVPKAYVEALRQALP